MPRLVKSDLEKYLVPTTSKTLDILDAFRSRGEELTLREITERTKVPHTTAFRILFTLVHRGYVSQVGAKKYRLNPVRRSITVGIAGLSKRVAISVSAVESFVKEAAKSCIDVIVLDNQDSADVAIENAHIMVAHGVDIVIEFQNNINAGPAIADIFGRAKIPTIALHIPQPGAVYFGPDNYRAGWTAGAALAEYALTKWGGRVDCLLLLDISVGGPLLQARMTGVVAGIRQVLGTFDERRIFRVDGAGDRVISKSVTEAILAKWEVGRRILIAGASDESALGALDALASEPRKFIGAIVGLDGSEAAREALAKKDSPFIGTVSFNSEKYGAALVDLALKILGGRPVDPFVYIHHKFISQANSV